MGWSRTNRLISEAATRLGGSCEPVSEDPTDFFMCLRHGSRRALISKTRSPFLTQVAQSLSRNKHVSRELLRRAGIPVVSGTLLDERHEPRGALARAQLERGPVVVKPNWGNRGLGVTPGVRDLDTFVRAHAWARDEDADEEVLVEPQVEGRDLRIAVIGGVPISAVEIQRPRLVGDGRSTVAQLVEELNEDPRRGDAAVELCPLDRIELDEALVGRLGVHGLGITSVMGHEIAIDLVGEETEVLDRTSEVAPEWLELAARACAVLGVDVGGVDLRGPRDAFAAAPGGGGGGVVLEVNVLPALHLHAMPTQGTGRPVFEAFVNYCLQLPGAPSVCAEVQACSPVFTGTAR